MAKIISKLANKVKDEVNHFINYDVEAFEHTLKHFSLPNDDKALSKKVEEKTDILMTVNHMFVAADYKLNNLVEHQHLKSFMDNLFLDHRDKKQFLKTSHKVLSTEPENFDKVFINLLSTKFFNLKTVCDIMANRFIDKCVLPMLNVSTARICEFDAGDKKYAYLHLGLKKEDYSAIISNPDALYKIAKTIADTPMQNEIAEYIYNISKVEPFHLDELINYDYAQEVRDIYSHYGYEI
ncbi:MAG: hypothetical protein ACK5WS_04170 [Alphaproteobacteria bacterium]|jgi:hypothetical protein|nr:hypothetical protein [Candidatus Jidaibacter sp.]